MYKQYLEHINYKEEVYIKLKPHLKEYLTLSNIKIKDKTIIKSKNYFKNFIIKFVRDTLNIFKEDILIVSTNKYKDYYVDKYKNKYKYFLENIFFDVISEYKGYPDEKFKKGTWKIEKTYLNNESYLIIDIMEVNTNIVKTIRIEFEQDYYEIIARFAREKIFKSNFEDLSK